MFKDHFKPRCNNMHRGIFSKAVVLHGLPLFRIWKGRKDNIRMPQECKHCPQGRNCLNGRFCEALNIYVEYKKEKPCKYESSGI